MQALFLFGALGEVWLMANHDQTVVSFVAENPWATLLVGPAFAAVTGVAIKEGLCYGKLNAATLALVSSFLLNTMVYASSVWTPLCVSHFRSGLPSSSHRSWSADSNNKVLNSLLRR